MNALMIFLAGVVAGQAAVLAMTAVRGWVDRHPVRWWDTAIRTVGATGTVTVRARTRRGAARRGRRTAEWNVDPGTGYRWTVSHVVHSDTAGDAPALTVRRDGDPSPYVW